MIKNSLGQIILNSNDCIELMYNGYNTDNIIVDQDTDIDLFNKYTHIMNNGWPLLKTNSIIDLNDIVNFDKKNQTEWFMPDTYKDLDIVNYLMEKAIKQTHTLHRSRTEAELKVYEERGLLDLLRFLVYFVETMRNYNIVWGVGRGSSVASYVLYLIGVHKVDSIKYELDFNEFLVGDKNGRT